MLSPLIGGRTQPGTPENRELTISCRELASDQELPGERREVTIQADMTHHGQQKRGYIVTSVSLQRQLQQRASVFT